jgi:hypothetical protein
MATGVFTTSNPSTEPGQREPHRGAAWTVKTIQADAAEVKVRLGVLEERLLSPATSRLRITAESAARTPATPGRQAPRGR